MLRFALFTATAMAAGAALLGSPAATAAPVTSTVTVAASATGPTTGSAPSRTAVVTATITVTGAPAVAATLAADEVPGRVTGVVVDNAPAPAGTYDATVTSDPERTRTLVRLGDGANATTGGTLGIGTHTVAITTDLSRRSGGPLRVTATVNSLNGSAAAPSATATIPLPDLTISVPRAQAARGVTLSPGGESPFLAEVGKRGPAVQASTLAITVPRGLQIDAREGVVRFDDSSDDEKGLRCTRASATTLTCPFGAVSGQVEVGLELEASAAATPGTTGALTLEIRADNGLDATPSDNTASTTVRFVPPARLRTSLTIKDRSIEVGSTGRLTASVTNAGTTPVSVIGIVAVGNKIDEDSDDEKQHFTITGFTGREGFPDDAGSGSSVTIGAASTVMFGGGATEVSALARRASSKYGTAKKDPNFRFWNIGTLAPGATIKAVITVRARSVGTGQAVVVAGSATGAGTCLTSAGSEAAALRCPEVGYVKLRAVTGAGTDGDGAIAATGVAATRLTVIGGALLLLGGLSLYAGSSRRRVVGRQRS